MLTLGLCLLLSVSSDIEACYATVHSACAEISCEAGVVGETESDCPKAVYDKCVADGEAQCRLRFPSSGGGPE